MRWLWQYLVKRAAWVVLVFLVGLLLAYIGVSDADASTFVGPRGGTTLAVPCDGPDDPPGCDPEETPTPTPTPTPEPTPTPTPTPTPEPTPLVVAWSPEDRDRVDLLIFSVVTFGAVALFSLAVISIGSVLRR